MHVEDGLALRCGEAYAVTGKSGSGKTLFLELIGLLIKPESGGSYLLKHPGQQALDISTVWHFSPERLADLRARTFGFVLQTGELMPFLSVRENIELPQKITGRCDSLRTDRLIGRLDLGRVENYRPGMLSVGQRQRVAVARALSHSPQFVIADEPTSALDPELSSGVIRLLVETANDEGAGVVIATHELSLLEHFDFSQLIVEVQDMDDISGITTSTVTSSKFA